MFNSAIQGFIKKEKNYTTKRLCLRASYLVTIIKCLYSLHCNRNCHDTQAEYSINKLIAIKIKVIGRKLFVIRIQHLKLSDSNVKTTSIIRPVFKVFKGGLTLKYITDIQSFNLDISHISILKITWTIQTFNPYLNYSNVQSLLELFKLSILTWTIQTFNPYLNYSNFQSLLELFKLSILSNTWTIQPFNPYLNYSNFQSLLELFKLSILTWTIQTFNPYLNYSNFQSLLE